MPGDRRTKDQRRADRERIAKLRLKHKTIAEIAEETVLSIPTINRELAIIRKEWKASAIEAIDEIKARELASLEMMEAEVLVEWERSKKDWQKKVVEDKPVGTRGGGGKSAKIETGGQTGDPRYMQVLLGIKDRRAKILGTDAPTKVAPTTPDGSAPYKPMNDAELDARILELSKKLGPEAATANGGS
jgi:hypothetical protein